MTAAACIPCMLVGADPSGDPVTIDPVKIPLANLGVGFFDEVARLGSRRRTDPAIFLNVWCAESALIPSAVSPIGARGLNQMAPQTLAYFGAPAEFEKLSGLEQLPWIEKFIAWTETANHGPFRSPERGYMGNFWPASLARPDDPSTLIVDRDSVDRSEAAAYDKNKGLDVNADGKITQGDIVAHLARVRRGFAKDFERLAHAVAALPPSMITWPIAGAAKRPAPADEASSRTRRREGVGLVASAVLLCVSLVSLDRARTGR